MPLVQHQTPLLSDCKLVLSNHKVLHKAGVLHLPRNHQYARQNAQILAFEGRDGEGAGLLLVQSLPGGAIKVAGAHLQIASILLKPKKYTKPYPGCR